MNRSGPPAAGLVSKSGNDLAFVPTTDDMRGSESIAPTASQKPGAKEILVLPPYAGPVHRVVKGKDVVAYKARLSEGFGFDLLHPTMLVSWTSSEEAF